MVFKKKGLRITREQWLRSIPRRVVEDFTRDSDGNIVIILELKPKGIVSKILNYISITPPPRYKKIVLDKMGSRVWMLCDGKHSVEDIIKILVKETGFSRRNIELSIYNYLKTLIMKGLIELHIPLDKEKASEK